MEDNSIVDLYWARSEDAITETSEKYGNTAMPSPIIFFQMQRTRMKV